jgi:hypothetical protein
MKWRPFLRFAWARKPGERYFWTDTADGYRLHQWAALQTAENEAGDQILQAVVGPLMLCLAARYADADD